MYDKLPQIDRKEQYYNTQTYMPPVVEKSLKTLDDGVRAKILHLVKKSNALGLFAPECADVAINCIFNVKTVSRIAAVLIALLRPGVSSATKIKQIESASSEKRAASDETGERELAVLGDIVRSAKWLSRIQIEGALRQVAVAKVN